MNLIELGAVLGAFFDGGVGPSHDQIDGAVRRTGLLAGDPAPGGKAPGGTPLGKTKRVRQILTYATDHDPAAGVLFAGQLVDLLRSYGAFEAALEEFAGADKIGRLAAAYERLGFVLDGTGGLRPLVLDNLSGTELSEALRAYVSRINLNPDDTALQVGSAKELDEAAARHVLLELTGDYPTGGRDGSFPVTLARAFTTLGLAPPPGVQLDPDPHRAVQQSMFLLAVSVNRLHNEVGTGHGRPDSSPKTPLTSAESRLVARASALLAGLLLDTLDHS